VKKKSYYLYLLFFVVLCLAVSGCQRDREEPLSKKKTPTGGDVDHNVAELLDALQMYRFDGIRKAPPFELQSITGETVSLNQYRGKVVLLSFWATW
jgi:cytochrome oxidase Cu insertion factor (SCO1/SenC/PrrC family)